MRTVVLSHRAKDALDAAIAQYPQLEEVYMGVVEWRLCRQPENGGYKVSKNLPIYLMCVRSWVDSPDLEVLYRFDENENEVHVLSIGLYTPLKP